MTPASLALPLSAPLKLIKLTQNFELPLFLTVFPLLGLRSPAIEGDAIFWLNTNSDGSTDNLTRHGGCPVLVGSKWITNKWVGYLDQGLENYPCGLKEKRRFKAFVDWRRR